MLLVKILLLYWIINVVFTDSQNIATEKIHNNSYYISIAQLVGAHFKNNGWHTILTVGRFPGDFYRHVGCRASFVNINLRAAEQGIDDVSHYSTNSVVLETYNMTHYKAAFNKVLESPYWHPHAHIFIINHERGEHNLAKMFFITWHYYAFNVAIIQLKDQETFLVTEYTPYVHEHFVMLNNYGCWTTKKLGALNYVGDFACEIGCQNVTLNSILRSKNLGTCLGYNTRETNLTDNLRLFQDKSKNYHGYTFRAHNQELVPFMGVKVDASGKATIEKRDGMIWNVMSEKMNFTMDLSPSKDILNKKFRVDTNVKQIVEFASRKVDLVLYPVYLMDLVIVDVDRSVQYKESGVCYLARRAPFVNTLFESINFRDNAEVVICMGLCITSLWFGIFMFYANEKEFSFDLAGRAFVNTMRNVLSNSLFKPPKQNTFRILMIASVMGFFIINFASQATIISYFTTFKRGKEVNTLDDIIKKGYPIIGLTTPDAILPDTEERFFKLNSKLVGTQDMYGCAYQMINDSRRFCLLECSLARFMRRNLLDEKGEQYLHVVEQRVHSHYLVMLLQKHSPMTSRFNRYLSMLVEAGLITKWEENRYDVKKEEIPIKPLVWKELDGIFKLFCTLLAIVFVVFLAEMMTANASRLAGGVRQKFRKWNSTRKATKQTKLKSRLGKIKLSTIGTQTTFEASLP